MKQRQTRNMAVMFADISDSTSLYQKLGDGPARNIVNACLDVVNGVLPRYDGRLVKTIGDEVMCVFPDADRAVLAASDMQSKVSAKKPGNYPVSIHIGLHCGPVLVEENDVFGDTVNVAAYLRAAATAEQILTTDAVERCLSAALKTRATRVCAVLKGSDQESTVFRCCGAPTGRTTDVSLQPSRMIPATPAPAGHARRGGVRVDQWRSGIIRRSDDCDLVRDRQLRFAPAPLDQAGAHAFLPVRSQSTGPSYPSGAEKRCTCCGASCSSTAPARSTSGAAARNGHRASSTSSPTGGRCTGSSRVTSNE
jgi:class 3 adenylate cyclase